MRLKQRKQSHLETPTSEMLPSLSQSAGSEAQIALCDLLSMALGPDYIHGC